MKTFEEILQMQEKIRQQIFEILSNNGDNEKLSFDELCDLVDVMTQKNFHTECRVEIAKWFHEGELMMRYNAILTIENSELDCPQIILGYRYLTDEELYRAIKYRTSKEQAEKLISILTFTKK